jgi:hypothetical protein
MARLIVTAEKTEMKDAVKDTRISLPLPLARCIYIYNPMMPPRHTVIPDPLRTRAHAGHLRTAVVSGRPHPPIQPPASTDPAGGLPTIHRTPLRPSTSNELGRRRG